MSETETLRETLSPLQAEGKRLGLYLSLPAQLLLLFIVLFPVVMVLYISTSDWTPYTGKNWTSAYEYWNSFAHFVYLAEDSRFWSALWRTLLIMAVAVPVQFFLGLGLAVLFVEHLPGKRLLYTILLTPMMIVPAVAGYMFFMLFQGSGPLNDLLSGLLGFDVSIPWLADPTLAVIAIIITEVWQWTPLMFLILLAGLVGIPEEQLKAATLLGANWVQKFWRIVLPQMKAVIIIAIALRLIECFKIFDTLFIMTSGGPGVSTETISVFMYKVTFLDLEWSYVAAIGLVILITLSLLAFFVMRQAAAVTAAKSLER